MGTQKINRSGLKELHNLTSSSCSFRTKIEGYLNEDLFADEIEVTDSDIEAGFSAANDSQRKILKKYFKQTEKVFTRVKTKKDVLAFLGIKDDFVLFPKAKTKLEKHTNAVSWIEKIALIYNEGWKEDFDNTSQDKYTVAIYRKAGSWVVGYNGWSDYMGFPSGLLFKSSELAMAAVNNFPEIFIDYFMVEGTLKSN